MLRFLEFYIRLNRVLRAIIVVQSTCLKATVVKTLTEDNNSELLISLASEQRASRTVEWLIRTLREN